MSTYAVIMAGGVGSRFWPVSRVKKPKQFLDILGLGKSLLQMTYDRFADILPAENIYIVANAAYEGLIKEQLPDISSNQILSEPVAKNTAPCIAYASYKIASKDPNAVMIVAPSDHLIMNEAEFKKQVNLASEYAKNNSSLVTLGIKPTRPDTGYGYIQYHQDHVQEGIHEVKTFTEKPNEELAEQFIESGDFLWNAGIFIWGAQSILNAFDQHLPEMAELFSSGNETYYSDEERQFVDRVYPVCQSISIDYGIIEKSESVVVLPSDFGWSDLGTWKSLQEVAEANEDNNVFISKHVEAHESSNNLVFAPEDKLVVLEGVSDVFVLDTGDALLVCHRSKEQEVKRIVNHVKTTYKEKYT